MRGLADDLGAQQSEISLAGAVDEEIFQSASVFDRDGRRDVFNDRRQEFFGAQKLTIGSSVHSLFSLPNVTLTPHSAGPTWDNWTKAYRNGFDNIQRIAAGRSPLWVVPELRDMVG